jgi:hypothetical protein
MVRRLISTLKWGIVFGNCRSVVVHSWIADNLISHRPKFLPDTPPNPAALQVPDLAPAMTEQPQAPNPAAAPNASTAQEHAPMLDVHPPHHAASTWRDFFIHIITIVIGLLIAIGLEQTVEYIHNRRQIAEARETIRQEITDNDVKIAHDVVILKQAETRLQSNLSTLQRNKTKPSTSDKLDSHWEWEGMQDSAWLTAQATGTLALMKYAEVQTYASAYKQQTIVEQNADTYLKLHNRGFAPYMKTHDLSKLTTGDLDKLIDGTSETLTQQQFLYWLSVSLQQSYAKALQLK